MVATSDTTFVLHGSKSEQVSSSSKFVFGLSQEVGLVQITEGQLIKILIANHFLFFKNLSKQPLSLIARFFHLFSIEHLLLFIPISPL